MGRTEAHGQLTAVSILEAFNVASRATSIGFAGGAEHGLVYNDFLQLFFSRISELDFGGVHTRACPCPSVNDQALVFAQTGGH